MENQQLVAEIQKLSKDLELQRSTFSTVIKLLDNLGDAVNDGFDKVNERLSALEGKQGMQGVNSQLLEIKHELHKIQKAYLYEDLFSTIRTFEQGQA